MPWVAVVVQAVVFIAALELLVRIHVRAAREHDRREKLLVNQIMALSGKPWEAPPAWTPPEEPEERFEPAPYLMANPEQLP